jgi:hypothetical protein
MIRTEERLADALAARAAAVDPASIRPLPVVPRVGEPHSRARRVWLAPVAAAVAIAVIAAVAGILAHRVLPVVRERIGGGMPAAGRLWGISAVTARDVWAVGSVDIGRTRWSNMTDEPLIVHWDGSSWRRVPAPTEPGGGQLSSIAGTSADNLWAVGTWYFNVQHPNEPMIMHWNGKNWRVVHFAAGTKLGGLNSVTALSASDAWAVGNAGPKNGALILHWNGSSWKRVRTPGPGPEQNLLSVAAISSHAAWAVGINNKDLLILRWNGSSWTKDADPRLHAVGPVLWSVAAESAGSVWAVGGTYGRHPGAIIMRRTSAAWWFFGSKPAAGDILSAVAVVSPHNVWAAGGGTGPKNGAVILHWNGTSWSKITSAGSTFPGGLDGITAISAGDVWAVGYRNSPGASVPRILHWDGTKWKSVYGRANTGS